jgi:hypothetical protein
VKILFLDIDGVLNDHAQHRNGYCGIDPQKAGLLDFVVGETGCRIVLASAWRYLILNGSMRIDGFRNMLLTHGVPQRTAAVVDSYLPADADKDDPHDRGKLARGWLDAFRTVTRFAAVDDLECGYREEGVPFVRTDGAKGIRPQDVYDLVKILNLKE